MGKLKNILAGCFVFIAVTASLYSCLDDETDMTEEETSSVSDEKEDHGSSGGKHDTGANGSGAAGTPVRISRSVRETETPMGDAGTWTVFVYMCGSDLESDGG
ncbi:MAG: Clostripain family protein, partial [Oscillospiraceae bacterium]|nr:Clostripain family protein [Oscillospiraceae bacterium]